MPKHSKDAEIVIHTKTVTTIEVDAKALQDIINAWARSKVSVPADAQVHVRLTGDGEQYEHRAQVTISYSKPE